ncbi:hypothetical protein CIRG_00511 [Coccidioides immitis RMSCC 2394]|uniref:Uncharacterized protein n=1 Tax=Coccidioides immitis RMSCC 2394 TaxID=404692 RepID=A0A0J6Y191_COCIT|nr:hypothetical protein CIRG_00511 [Coccidioides immitis RMSCC 2394]
MDISLKRNECVFSKRPNNREKTSHPEKQKGREENAAHGVLWSHQHQVKNARSSQVVTTGDSEDKVLEQCQFNCCRKFKENNMAKTRMTHERLGLVVHDAGLLKESSRGSVR